MRTRWLVGGAVVAVTACACSGHAEPSAGPSPAVSASRAATASPAPHRPPPARPTRPPGPRLCPNPPPKNGPLSDQNEPVGRVGQSSATFINEQGRLYCIIVASVTRQGGAVVVTVRVVSRRPAPISMDGDVAVTVSLAYGPNGAEAGRDYSVGTAIRGILPPGGTVSGTYGFAVPAGPQSVTVTAGPVVGDQFAWTGRV